MNMFQYVSVRKQKNYFLHFKNAVNYEQNEFQRNELKWLQLISFHVNIYKMHKTSMFVRLRVELNEKNDVIAGFHCSMVSKINKKRERKKFIR